MHENRDVAAFCLRIGLRQRVRIRLRFRLNVRFDQRFVEQRIVVRQQVERIVFLLDLRLRVRIVVLRKWFGHHERIEFQRRRDGDILNLADESASDSSGVFVRNRPGYA